MKHFLILFVLLAGISATAAAQNNYFLQLEGIKGEVTDANHKDWIDIETFTRGVQRPQRPRAKPGREGGPPVFTGLCITKKADLASIPIEEAASKGTLISKAILHVTRNVGGARQVYLKYELENVTVTEYGIAGEEPEYPVDNFCLKFRKIKATYVRFDAAGKPAEEKTYEWDINKGAGK